MNDEQKTYRVGFKEKRFLAGTFLLMALFGMFASLCHGCSGSPVSRTTLRVVDTTVMTGCDAYRSFIHPMVQRELNQPNDAGVESLQPVPKQCLYRAQVRGRE